MMAVSEIQNFYKGAHVFLTGGTGFVGVILVEKLLRCTEVEKIYLLVREKRNVDAKARFDKFFDDTVFDKVKMLTSNYKERVCLIVGNIVEKDLGICVSDQKILTENVDVFFHVAATVRFNERIKQAFQINVESSVNCLSLAKKIKKLKAFVHVSTAYSNFMYKEVEEKFYDYPISYEEVRDIIETFNDNETTKRLSKILGDWPNTYTFTKALSESFIRQNSAGLPIGIFRPSIVISSYKEPFEGWTNNNNAGLTRQCHLICLGRLRVFPIDKECRLDTVPVDYCVSALIASSWDIFERNKYRNKKYEIPIFNYVNSSENFITSEDLFKLTCMYAKNFPFLEQSWAVMLVLAKHAAHYTFCKFLLHYLPALCLDILLLVFLQKPKYIKYYKRVHYHLELLIPFALREWKFDNANVRRLWKNMGKRDRELFPFNMNDVFWLNYFKNYVKGIRLYLQKDPASTLRRAKNKQKMLSVTHNATKVVFVVVTSKLICWIVAELFKILKTSCLY